MAEYLVRAEFGRPLGAWRLPARHAGNLVAELRRKHPDWLVTCVPARPRGEVAG